MSERQARVATDEGVYIPTTLAIELSTLPLIQSLPPSFKIAPGVVVPSLLLLSP